jgi:hypothetical protein
MTITVFRSPRSRSIAHALSAAALISYAAAAEPQHAVPPAPMPQPGLELALTVTALIDAPISMGKTPLGERRVITISGGTFEGSGLKGTIMPGGEDWQVDRPDGVTVFDARYWLKTDDGVIIRVVNRAIAWLPDAERAKTARGEAPDRSKSYLRTSPEFEAPVGKYDWLNKAIFIGTLTGGSDPKPFVVLRFYKVT